ncbi:uncharacterized protein BJ171DRAFT_509708 [Polychytrium aggregatum]|uniref:uncharacterized protein n=1 Tax=Polychytrium aggregatum TaxID=110093 RepID=UPI0022FF424F|nr:uncharacterized protein BJ171DRAFT_509708 [Polychytrium aggregatum]KAI9203466.1 hypothetical protein BJ171DRAFT_509708 [Polychytrium aggregatum]
MHKFILPGSQPSGSATTSVTNLRNKLNLSPGSPQPSSVTGHAASPSPSPGHSPSSSRGSIGSNLNSPNSSLNPHRHNGSNTIHYKAHPSSPYGSPGGGNAGGSSQPFSTPTPKLTSPLSKAASFALPKPMGRFSPSPTSESSARKLTQLHKHIITSSPTPDPVACPSTWRTALKRKSLPHDSSPGADHKDPHGPGSLRKRRRVQAGGLAERMLQIASRERSESGLWDFMKHRPDQDLLMQPARKYRIESSIQLPNQIVVAKCRTLVPVANDSVYVALKDVYGSGDVGPSQLHDNEVIGNNSTIEIGSGVVACGNIELCWRYRPS